MIVRSMRVRIVIRGARSLKDKRRILKSLKDRIRNKFNVSVAEVDAQDRHQLGVLGVAVVSNERRFTEEVFSQVVNLVRMTPGAELIDFQMDR
jgi:hypothetical protein